MIVVTMHIDDSTYRRGNKIYRRVLLRDSYRKNGKVLHHTIANLSKCSDVEIAAIKLALKHKEDLKNVLDTKKNIETQQGLSVGAVLLIDQILRRLNIKVALGNSKKAKLIQWLIMATLIEQGSRLSAARLAKKHAACDVLGIRENFHENSLYTAMDWLSKLQNKIEDKLFKFRYKNKKPNLYLYDVTSSYLEGQQNELAAYGYNRDKKKGKLQIVIGLMTDGEGNPIAIEVFEGNTNDTKTFASQIKKLSFRFKADRVTLVGDRGMIKSTQTEDLNQENFNYITAITKKQILKLAEKSVIQLAFFDETLAEVEAQGIRYILRRNPARKHEIEETRKSKVKSLEKFTHGKNDYLKQHKKAKIETAKKNISQKIDQLNLNWIQITEQNNQVILKEDQEKLAEVSLLDGCYVLKSNLPANYTKEEIHDRYKDLAEVERAFRTMKTSFLELRPIYVRKANRTRAHVFIIMLAYMIEKELRRNWTNIDITVQEGISELSSLCSLTINFSDKVSYQTIPKPRIQCAELLKASMVKIPFVIPCMGANVYTTKKLPEERKSL